MFHKPKFQYLVVLNLICSVWFSMGRKRDASWMGVFNSGANNGKYSCKKSVQGQALYDYGSCTKFESDERSDVIGTYIKHHQLQGDYLFIRFFEEYESLVFVNKATRERTEIPKPLKLSSEWRLWDDGKGWAYYVDDYGKSKYVAGHMEAYLFNGPSDNEFKVMYKKKLYFLQDWLSLHSNSSFRVNIKVDGGDTKGKRIRFICYNVGKPEHVHLNVDDVFRCVDVLVGSKALKSFKDIDWLKWIHIRQRLGFHDEHFLDKMTSRTSDKSFNSSKICYKDLNNRRSNCSCQSPTASIAFVLCILLFGFAGEEYWIGGMRSTSDMECFEAVYDALSVECHLRLSTFERPNLNLYINNWVEEIAIPGHIPALVELTLGWDNVSNKINVQTLLNYLCNLDQHGEILKEELTRVANLNAGTKGYGRWVSVKEFMIVLATHPIFTIWVSQVAVWMSTPFDQYLHQGQLWSRGWGKWWT